mmetsp:Transcript_79794/g.243981  ORF Transcript_79794/g.243981 Transcript_79794/m.243981 type:complete len:457 (-) Transcript_79794:2872-4242(-)
MFKSWKLRPALANETHGRIANNDDHTPLIASHASRGTNNSFSRSSPCSAPTLTMAASMSVFKDSGIFMDWMSNCACSNTNWASSLLVLGCNLLNTFSSSLRTESLLVASISAFCMQPYGNATAWGVRMSLGSLGCNKARFKLFDPTCTLSIWSGRMHHEQPKGSDKFIFTFVLSALAWSSATLVALAASPVGRGFASISSVPLGLQRTSTHLPLKSCSSCSEIFGSKHVASNTPKFRARTAQCDKMSGASLAERTRTPTTPSGTSSSPLTAPDNNTVGVSNTLSWMCIILSINWNSPCTGLSTGEIICHGGKCAISRSTGSNRCSTKLTAIRDVPRKTSSTKTSMFRFGASICSPKNAAFGPMSCWHLSHNSPTTRLVRSAMALRSNALSVGPFHFCCAAAPPRVFQSARIAWSSSSVGRWPTSEVSKQLSWSPSCTRRASAPMPWMSTLCCVSQE